MCVDFEKWLNKILKEGFSVETVAIHFNLYEEVDFNWAIQLVATKYLECGQYAADLKKYMAIGIGFVSGDIKILY